MAKNNTILQNGEFMLETRYEEHSKTLENLPCGFQPSIERTVHNYSKQTNWHDNLEIELCLEGEGYILLDGEKISFKKHDIAVINSNVIHYTSTDSFLNYSCLIIDTKFSKSAGIDPAKINFTPLIKNDFLKERLFKIAEISADISDSCRTAKLQREILEILIHLKENYTVFEQNIPNHSKYFETVKTAIHYIKENYHKKISLDSLAQTVFSDKYSLSKHFKSVTGSTVVQYINSYRCEKAIELIREGSPINEAAVKCGFNNMSFFTRTFKSYTGKLPSEYKK